MKSYFDFQSKFMPLFITAFLLTLFFAPPLSAQTAREKFSQIVWAQPPLPESAFMRMQSRSTFNANTIYTANINTCRLKENQAIHNIKNHITYITNTGPRTLITTITAATPGYYLRC